MDINDPRLQVTSQPRPDIPAGLADIPMLTIVWRALKAEHARRAGEWRTIHDEEERRRDALTRLAGEVFSLRLALDANKGGVNVEHALVSLKKLEATLEDLGVIILAAEGVIYDEVLMEVIDNLAQKPMPDLLEAKIIEIVSPAILYKGNVVQHGKAIIAVPERS